MQSYNLCTDAIKTATTHVQSTADTINNLCKLSVTKKPPCISTIDIKYIFERLMVSEENIYKLYAWYIPAVTIKNYRRQISGFEVWIWCIRRYNINVSATKYAHC